MITLLVILMSEGVAIYGLWGNWHALVVYTFLMACRLILITQSKTGWLKVVKQGSALQKDVTRLMAELEQLHEKTRRMKQVVLICTKCSIAFDSFEDFKGHRCGS